MANFGKDISKYKMVIYLKDRSQQTFYSLVEEDKKGETHSCNGMTRRLLDKLYRNKYSTALIYDRDSDCLVAKYIDGAKVQI